MKLIYVCFILMSSIFVTNLGVNEETNNMCEALKSILQLGILNSPLNVQYMDQTFTNCINSSNGTFFINLRTNETRTLSKSSLVIVETKKDILKLVHLMNYNNHHLIVVQKYSLGDLDEIVYIFWKKLLINVSFLVTGNSTVMMQTFIPYNEENCNDTKLKTINWFNEKTGTWKTNDFFPKKLVNFYGCKIKIATHKNVIPYIVREEYVDKKRVLKGRVIQMIDALSVSLNFTADLDYENSVAGWENCYLKVTNNEADLFIGNVALDPSRINSLDFSLPIFFEFLKFVIPPGKYYTQIENFARVFDRLTWALIFSVLLLIGTSVLILSFLSKKVRIYAFGDRYSNAFMDFLATIFGSTLSSLPDMNVPRLIIVEFVLFCFLIRTLYQGSLYNFLQSGAQAEPVQSIDEMVSNGFTFFMLKGYGNFINLSAQKHASKKYVDISEFDNILEKISDTNFKGTLMHTSSLIVYKNGLDNRNKSIFCKEYLMTVSMVAYLRKNFYLTEIVNAKIGIFHAAGLIDFWDRRSKFAIEKNMEANDNRKPLNLKNFKGLFKLFIYALIACVLCCLAEIIFKSIKDSFTYRKKARNKHFVRRVRVRHNKK